MSVKTKVTDGMSVTSVRDTDEKVEKNIDTAVAAITTAAETAAQDFAAQQGDTPIKAPINVPEGLTKTMKYMEDALSFNRANLAAAMEAARIFANGLQNISKQVTATTQASIEESVATMKAIAGVKSAKEVIDLQTSFARTMIEKTVAESGTLTDASMRLTEQAIAPLTARLSLAVRTFSNAA